MISFSVDFCIQYAEYPPYVYFRSTWPTELKSLLRGFPLREKISTKYEVNTTIRRPLPSYSVLAAGLDLSPFDLGQWSTPTKFEAPTAVCSWVMSSNTSTLNMTFAT